jgi:Domain of unknown function (DUF4133)
MAPTIYPINRGINRPLEFHRLKAQYILYAGGIITGDMVLIAILFISGTTPWLCLALAGIVGFAGIGRVYYLSNTYGQYGLLKKRAAIKIPRAIRCNSVLLFINLKKNYETQNS